MSWGSSRRPIVSSTLSYPNPTEGSDGDIQIRQTNLGAKLFGKIGRTWYGAPLTGTAGDPVMRIGTKLENHLSISGDKLEFIKGSKSMLSITSTGDINMTGKIVLSSAGTRNVCIGTGNNDAGEDNISIGVNAGSSLTSSETSNVLIGTNAGKDIGSAGTTGDDNICIGSDAGRNISSGLGNLVIGTDSGETITTGSRNLVVGWNVETPASDTNISTVIGMSNVGDIVSLGVGTTLIGNMVGAAEQSVYQINNATAWSQTCDRRLKRNIVDAPDNGLTLINQLRLRNFNWEKRENLPKSSKGNAIYYHDSDKLRLGFIAQELEEVLPQCVTEDGLGYKSAQIDEVQYLMIKAVQELSAKIDTMQTEINNLKAE